MAFFKKTITVSSMVFIKEKPGETWIHATEGDDRVAVSAPGCDDESDIYLDRQQLLDWAAYYTEAVKVLDEANRIKGKAATF